MKSRSSPWAITVLIFVLLGLSACQTSPRAPDSVPVQKPDAEEAFAKGDYVQAARTWQKEALDASPGEAGDLRVKAADAWLRLNSVSRTRLSNGEERANVCSVVSLHRGNEFSRGLDQSSGRT